MEQVYWLSTATDEDTDTRNLVYRYGRFVYAGAVITEPVSGLEFLPGVLQGIQAVQGQIPYISEFADLPADSPHRVSLKALEGSVDTIHAEIAALEPRVAALAESGATWLEADDAAVYFEFEARPGFTCNGSDVVFAKSYRGDVLLTIIWYGPAGRFYVSLTPAGGEEQALVDTLFPSIYGKRRGAALASYEPPAQPALPAAVTGAWNGEVSVAAVLAAIEAAEAAAASGGSDGKAAERASAAGLGGKVLPAWKLFAAVSVWEASEPVPDPDAVLPAEDGSSSGGSEAEEDEEDEEDDDEAAEAVAAAIDAASRMLGALSVAGGGVDELTGGTVDLSGGSGYTQVYAVMAPGAGTSGAAASAAMAAAAFLAPAASARLVPRAAMFRFGDWVYAGLVDFPVDALRLGDVPFVLPALQKQQGRLSFLSEARTFPVGHPMTAVMRSFMSAVALLRAEMEAAQDELATLAEQSVNAWVDADWAASFFEMALAPGALLPPALAGVEVIACKIYLHQGAGIVLHVVYFGGSLYCVLADSVEDLPLLDVAFPDVTARNRVVQVRTYDDKAARKLAAAHTIKLPAAAATTAAASGTPVAAAANSSSSNSDAADSRVCPLPLSLRVWEGRRRGIPGVGYGAAAALSDDHAAGVGSTGDAIRERARVRAEAEAAAAASKATATAAAVAEARAAKAAAGAKTAAAAAAASDSKAEGKEADAPAPAAKAAAAASAAAATPAAAAAAPAAAAAAPASSRGSSAAAPATSTASAASESKGGEGADDDAAAWRSASAASGGGRASAAAAGGRAGAGAALPAALMGGSGARAPHHLAPLLKKGGAAAGEADGGLGGNGLDDARNRLLLPAGALAGSADAESKLAEAPWDASGRPKAK